MDRSMELEVEDRLKELRITAMRSVSKKAAANNLKSFNKIRMGLEASWMREKTEFIEEHNKVLSLLRTNLPRTSSSGPVLTGHKQKKALAYAEVVKKLNHARLNALRFNPATAFRDSYTSLSVRESTGKISIREIWDLVRMLAGEDIIHHSRKHRSISNEMSLVLGAKRYLEWRHVKYIMSRISEDPVLAALGGEVVNLKQIRAFLRVHLKDYGVLDFDAGHDACSPPPVDTTWQQIYFCMRAGYYDEARTVASSSNASQEFAPLLNEWITSGGMVSVEIAATASDELDMMLRPVNVKGGAGYEKEKLLLYSLISGSRSLFDSLLEDQPTLFDTEEDFYWFRLSSIREPVGAASTVMNAGLEPYTLKDLQVYVNNSAPGTYTTNGADPLMYPYVLLLSIQLITAIVYMSNEIGGEGYNIDAAHISIALADHGVLSEVAGAGQGIGVMDAYEKASRITKQYGSVNFLPDNLSMALEYYAQAAAVLGGGRLSWPIRGNVDQQRQRNLMLKHVLTELLMREGGICLLLGSRGKEGELSRFFTDVEGRIQFLHEAAQQCQEVGLSDKSLEITNRIGDG
ncbi:nuclear pore complex protein NUP93A [Rosa chinensis]|nr:nuclear pore complex protein NUP93A [Rosa chinensis]